MWPTSHRSLLYASPNDLCTAEWARATCPFELGGLPVAWQVSARSHPDSAVPEWNAYFTAGLPHEVLVDFLFAFDSREEPTACFDRPGTVLAAACAQGWIRDIDRPRTTVLDPRLVGGISLEDVPVPVQDSDPRSGLLGWQAWAEPVLGDPYLWCASFSASVPHDLVAMFASSLASPHPVRGKHASHPVRAVAGGPAVRGGPPQEGARGGLRQRSERPNLSGPCGLNGCLRLPLHG